MKGNFICTGHRVRCEFRLDKKGDFTMRHTKVITIVRDFRVVKNRFCEFYSIQRRVKCLNVYVSFVILVKRGINVIRNVFTVEDTGDVVSSASEYRRTVDLFEQAKRIEVVYERLSPTLGSKLINTHVHDVENKELGALVLPECGAEDTYNKLLDVVTNKTGYGLCE